MRAPNTPHLVHFGSREKESGSQESEAQRASAARLADDWRTSENEAGE